MMALLSSEGTTDRAEFLTKMLDEIDQAKASKIVVCFLDKNGDPITGYLNCNYSHLQLFGQSIQDLATCQMIASNWSRITDIIAEDSEDSDADID